MGNGPKLQGMLDGAIAKLEAFAAERIGTAAVVTDADAYAISKHVYDLIDEVIDNEAGTYTDLVELLWENHWLGFTEPEDRLIEDTAFDRIRRNIYELLYVKLDDHAETIIALQS